MDNMPPRRSANRSTFGEALIVIAVLAGFFVAFMQGNVSFVDIGALAAFLGVITAFYMALLFCRMLFFWMTGGDQTQYPWWVHEEKAKKIK